MSIFVDLFKTIILNSIPGKETTLFFFGTHIHFIAYFLGSILGFALLNRKFISITKVLQIV